MHLAGGYSSVEEIPENLVHDHEKNGLPRLSSLPLREITHRLWMDYCTDFHPANFSFLISVCVSQQIEHLL